MVNQGINSPLQLQLGIPWVNTLFIPMKLNGNEIYPLHYICSKMKVLDNEKSLTTSPHGLKLEGEESFPFLDARTMAFKHFHLAALHHLETSLTITIIDLNLNMVTFTRIGAMLILWCFGK
jgi:hypothetical protein